VAGRTEKYDSERRRRAQEFGAGGASQEGQGRISIKSSSLRCSQLRQWMLGTGAGGLQDWVPGESLGASVVGECRVVWVRFRSWIRSFVD